MFLSNLCATEICLETILPHRSIFLTSWLEFQFLCTNNCAPVHSNQVKKDQNGSITFHCYIHRAPESEPWTFLQQVTGLIAARCCSCKVCVFCMLAWVFTRYSICATPATDWRPIQGVLHLWQLGHTPTPLQDPKLDKWKMDGWN